MVKNFDCFGPLVNWDLAEMEYLYILAKVEEDIFLGASLQILILVCLQ